MAIRGTHTLSGKPDRDSVGEMVNGAKHRRRCPHARGAALDDTHSTQGQAGRPQLSCAAGDP